MYNLSRNSKLFARVARDLHFSVPEQSMLKLNRACFSSMGGSSTGIDNGFIEGKSFSTNTKTSSDAEKISYANDDPLLNVITDSQMQTNVRTIPWFQSNMPETYFRQIPEEMRIQHLIAVSAIRQLGKQP